MKKQHALRCSWVTLLVLVASTAAAEPPIRIEEDWELHVTQPDAQIDAPQVTTMLLPAGDNSDLILQVHLNHASVPAFSRGGLQVLASADTDTLAQVRTLDEQVLDQQSEIIRWTQVVQQAGSGLYFGVINGTSSSWGAFGDNSTFVYVTHADAGFTTLDNYNAQESLDNSSVSFAGNRVAWLRLKKVRLFNSAGAVAEWTLNADVE